jgi:hypothetical protein
MTHANRTLPKRPAASNARPRRATLSPARSRHAASFTDAVVNVYVHDISARHRRRAS